MLILPPSVRSYLSYKFFTYFECLMDPQECVLGSEEVSLIHKSLGGYVGIWYATTQYAGTECICPLTMIEISKFYAKTKRLILILTNGFKIQRLVENVKN